MTQLLRRYVSGAVQVALRQTAIEQPLPMIDIQHDRPVLRSLFYVKKSKITTPQCWLAKVRSDAFILDLEDSVAAGEKQEIRAQISKILPTLPEGHQQCLIRLNNPSNSPRDWILDLRLADERLLGFIVPKASVEDIVACDHALDAVEAEKGLERGRIRLFPMLETARGIEDSACIARASKRNAGMMFGRYDLQRSLGCSANSTILEQAYHQVLMAARGAHIAATASVNCDLDNHNLFETECKHYYQMGFAGRSVLTAAQAVIANREFTIADHDRQFSATAQSVSEGVKVNNRAMFGPPHLRRAGDLATIIEAQRRVDAIRQDGVVQCAAVTPQLISPKNNQLGTGIGQVQGWRESPFCATVSAGMVAVWYQHFLSNSSLNSTYFANELWNMDAPVVPYGLLLNLTMSLSVVVFSYPAKVHLELVSTKQFKQVKVGTPLRNRVRVVFLEDKGKMGEIVTSEHQLLTNDGELVFSAIKKTLFPAGTFSLPRPEDVIDLKDISNPVDECLPSPSTSTSPVKTPKLEVGQVLVHEMVKVFGPHDAVSLSYLLKGVNPLHVNSHRYSTDQLLVSGPCVVAATIANSGFDLGDVMADQMLKTISVNKTNNGDMISTVGKVIHLEPMGDGHERVTMRLLGIRNVDPMVLASTQIPEALFDEEMRPAKLEKICADQCPTLFHKVVIHGTRRFIRRKSA